MTEAEAMKIVAVLRAAYPSWKTTKETAELWASMLVDLEYSFVNAAVRRVIMSEDLQFPPSIGRIREEAAALSNPQLTLSAEEAWGEVLAAVKHWGRNRVPQWSCWAVGAAVDALGWAEICNSEEGDVGIRAHFFRTFNAYQHRAKDACNLPDDLQIDAPRRKLMDGPQAVGDILRLQVNGKD